MSVTLEQLDSTLFYRRWPNLIDLSITPSISVVFTASYSI